MTAPRTASWIADLEARHLADLEFAEVRRGLQALSSAYVERRARLGSTLDGAGKRAAFALFYGPIHFLVLGHVVRALGAHHAAPARILDLGCGTGAAGAGWALECPRRPEVLGVDVHPWAVAEARRTYAALGIRGTARRGEITRARLPGAGAGIVLAWAVNEIADEHRNVLLDRLRLAVGRGASLLVVEPIARTPVPWWASWVRAFESDGGRADTWRWSEPLPEVVAHLDRAAGLDHRELTARSLYVPRPATPKKDNGSRSR